MVTEVDEWSRSLILQNSSEPKIRQKKHSWESQSQASYSSSAMSSPKVRKSSLGEGVQILIETIRSFIVKTHSEEAVENLQGASEVPAVFILTRGFYLLIFLHFQI